MFFGTLLVRRWLAQDAADARLEDQVPLIFGGEPGDDVAGLYGDPTPAGEAPRYLLIGPGFFFVPEGHQGSTPEPSRRDAAVDVIEPDDILLVELPEGDLQDPHLLPAGG